ncbi:MAG: ATP-binding protein [Phycisphaerae bacterium]
MKNPLTTLRARLVFTNLVVFGVVQLALVGLAYYICTRFFSWDFDQRLLDGAQSTAELIDLSAAASNSQPTSQRYQPRVNPFRFLVYYFQIRARDDVIIERSPNLGESVLPLSPRARDARRTLRPVLETLQGPLSEKLVGPEQTLRLITIYDDPESTVPYYLQIAISSATIDQSLRALERTFMLLVPLGLALSAGASWLLVRRSLGPIGRIAREARSLTAARLDRRLPVPAGQDEVVALVTTLNDMLDRLESAFRSQERFVANAAHELRTPVTHLLGEAQLLLRQHRGVERYGDFVASVQAEMRGLAQIVESLLALARADAGLAPEQLQRVSINETVSDALERSHAYARQHEVRVQAMLPPVDGDAEPPEVSGDHELLVTLVANLLRNAIRHSPPGQVVDVAVQRSESRIAIRVRDRGPGIAASDLPHIFEPFYQGDRSTVAPHGGAGLGLSIAVSVVRLHGGTISAQNRPDGGCEVEINLPPAAPELT